MNTNNDKNLVLLSKLIDFFVVHGSVANAKKWQLFKCQTFLYTLFVQKTTKQKSSSTLLEIVKVKKTSSVNKLLKKGAKILVLFKFALL